MPDPVASAQNNASTVVGEAMGGGRQVWHSPQQTLTTVASVDMDDYERNSPSGCCASVCPSVRPYASPVFLQQILMHDDDDDALDLAAVLISTEAARRNVIENEAYFERRGLLKVFLGRMKSGSGGDSHALVAVLTANGTSTRQQRASREVDAAELQQSPGPQLSDNVCVGEAVGGAGHMKRTSLVFTEHQSEELRLLTFCSSVVMKEGPVSPVGHVVDEVMVEEEQQEPHALYNSAGGVKCYGAVGNVGDERVSFVKGDGVQGVLRFSSVMRVSMYGAKGRSAWCVTPYPYQQEESVFQEGTSTSADAAAAAAAAVEWGMLATVDALLQSSSFGRITRHLVLRALTVGIIGLMTLHGGLVGSMDILVKVDEPVSRENSLKFSLAVVNAVAFSLFVPLVCIPLRGMHAMPHIVLLAATSATVGSAFCLTYGFSQGDFGLLFLGQVLHGIGFSGCVVSLLLFSCVKVGAELGIPSFLSLSLYTWLACSVLGFFVFPSIARNSSGGTVEAVGVFLLAAWMALVLALGVCLLLPPAACHGAFNNFLRACSSPSLRMAVWRLELCFVFRALAYACLLSGVYLLTIGGQTLQVSPSLSTPTSTVRADGKIMTPLGFSAGETCLLFLSALVALPLSLVPLFGPVVRLGECGLAAAAATAALAVVLSTDSASFSPSAAITCGVSLALTMAGLLRSLAVVQCGSLAAASALLLVVLLAACMILLQGIAAGLLGYRLQPIGTGTEEGVSAMQRRDVLYTSLTVCSAAVLLQVAASLHSLYMYHRHHYGVCNAWQRVEGTSVEAMNEQRPRRTRELVGV